MHVIDMQVAVNWSTYGALYTEEIDTRRSQALTKGTKGHEFIETLDVRPGEPVIEKTRFSALVQGSSELDAFVRARGIDTLLITGWSPTPTPPTPTPTTTPRCAPSTPRSVTSCRPTWSSIY
jgi:hypothetical protein